MKAGEVAKSLEQFGLHMPIPSLDVFTGLGNIAPLLLGKSTFLPPLHTRAPYHLARDEQGRYFYVDRGNTPETEKSFRLFVGPKGAMKLQKMTNTVADTEGEIFTTKSGSLRYVTDRKNPPVWIQGAKKTKLTAARRERPRNHQPS